MNCNLEHENEGRKAWSKLTTRWEKCSAEASIYSGGLNTCTVESKKLTVACVVSVCHRTSINFPTENLLLGLGIIGISSYKHGAALTSSAPIMPLFLNNPKQYWIIPELLWRPFLLIRRYYQFVVWRLWFCKQFWKSIKISMTISSCNWWSSKALIFSLLQIRKRWKNQISPSTAEDTEAAAIDKTGTVFLI